MCVHDNGSRRPHIHLLIATRKVNPDGTFFKKKCRELMKESKYISIWRCDWAERLSYECERRGLPTRYFHESYKERGIDKEPMKFVHRGIYKNGIQTDRVLENKARQECNRIKELARELERGRDFDRDMVRDYER